MKSIRQVLCCAPPEKFPKSLDGIKELRCAGTRQFSTCSVQRLEAENFSRPMAVSSQPPPQFIQRRYRAMDKATLSLFHGNSLSKAIKQGEVRKKFKAVAANNTTLQERGLKPVNDPVVLPQIIACSMWNGCHEFVRLTC
jgi:hypothetical protein